MDKSFKRGDRVTLYVFGKTGVKKSHHGKVERTYQARGEWVTVLCDDQITRSVRLANVTHHHG